VLLRTLGASGSFLKWSQQFEMALIGLFSGLVATVLAYGAFVILAERLFSFVPSVSNWWLLAGIAASLVISYLVGWWAQRGIHQFSSVDLLRDS
jgi:predicted lysophospholipase L1 biosynthesis ABC-type transport system permease subunit